jgi:hypothetical protein
MALCHFSYYHFVFPRLGLVCHEQIFILIIKRGREGSDLRILYEPCLDANGKFCFCTLVCAIGSLFGGALDLGVDSFPLFIFSCFAPDLRVIWFSFSCRMSLVSR